MGKEVQAPQRVVLDTNVLVSALLFEGQLARFVDLWKNGAIVPLLCRETCEELVRVLQYPRFRLTGPEIRAILQEEILPYFEVVEIRGLVLGVCGDPDDDIFLSCALSGGASVLISGDRGLQAIGSYEGVKVKSPASFLRSLQ